MSRIYENPPIIEAICEFRFEPSQPWDWTVPGLVYAEIKNDFPEKREERTVPLQVHPGPQEVTYSLSPALAKMQFLRKDESAMIQVGPDLLAVNQFKPYPQWDATKEPISRALAVYRKVAVPKALRRIGLRYVNRIQIPEEQVRIDDYLLATPKAPEKLPQFFATWAQRIEIPIEDANGMLVLQAGSVREKEQSSVVFLLDLDFVTLDPRRVALEDALDWVDAAHCEIEQAFEACITDKARKLFKEVTS
jgi:uncharacterized protein (TIGR04255 family)